MNQDVCSPFQSGHTWQVYRWNIYSVDNFLSKPWNSCSFRHLPFITFWVLFVQQAHWDFAQLNVQFLISKTSQVMKCQVSKQHWSKCVLWWMEEITMAAPEYRRKRHHLTMEKGWPHGGDAVWDHFKTKVAHCWMYKNEGIFPSIGNSWRGSC